MYDIAEELMKNMDLPKGLQGEELMEHVWISSARCLSVMSFIRVDLNHIISMCNLS